MKPPGRERIRMLRFEGDKPLTDAIMILDTLLTLQAAAHAADGIPWLLTGSQAASCYMESRATVEIEVLVPAEQAGVPADSLALWSSRARRDEVEGSTVLIPQAADLLLLMLAERRVIQAQYAMYFAARLLQLYGPVDVADADLSPHQQARLGEVAALVMHHAADVLERLFAQIGA